MISLCKAAGFIPEINNMLKRLSDGGTPVAISGVSHVHKAHIVAAARRRSSRPILVICPDEQELERLSADIASLSQESVMILRERDFCFHDAFAVSREWERQRLSLLYELYMRRAPIICATPDALMQRTLTPDALSGAVLTLKPGMTLKPEELKLRLSNAGYAGTATVESVGQYAARGGIIDFFPPPGGEPVRVEFYGDEIDTIAAFNPESQRRSERLDEARLYPLCEACYGAPEAFAARLREFRSKLRKQTPEAVLSRIDSDLGRLENGMTIAATDRYMALLYPEFTTALDYFERNCIVFSCEQGRMRERIKNTVWRYSQELESLLESGEIAPGMSKMLLEQGALWARLAHFDCVFLDTFLDSSYDLRPHYIGAVQAKQLPSYGGSLETAIGDIRHYIDSAYSTVALCPDARRASQLAELLRDHGLPAALDHTLASLPEAGRVVVAQGALSAGMEYPGIKLALISEGQIHGNIKRAKSHKAPKDARNRVQSYADLNQGDLVVHDHHGIGRFMGMVILETDGVKRDYLHLSYGGGDTLYVPVTKVHLISKYIGAAEDAATKLHKLSGAEWNRARTRAKSAVRDLAKGLTALYAERKRRPGYAFPPDDAMQAGFEEAFPYVETEDQLRCVSEIKADMHLDIPMDRLLCGDVGFGKTEVAFRAVMKCVLSGKQAAFLVPTTVLAQQHYITALRRFANYPVHIDVVSRFKSTKEISATLRKTRLGAVDLLIGTHRLLQKDIKFKDLGLLIVDEEQRFGVSHKEKLKELARQVDVLTLTATPIPRTLNMALSGIRDMSTIEEAPRDRSPVQTFVLEHNWSVILDALRRETARGGQAYYLHNRVETIDKTAAKIKELMPELTIGVAHGQMGEEALSSVMRSFMEGDISLLVCTTIIETGIDIPNVNTLIVEDADRLGLAQLHQIRGRVGRSPRHAYAYLTYRSGKVLNEVAAKRLSAIREFSEFGSGFKIAMRDLEIRGAGNVLGAEQSGHLVSVGYDMYLRLLEEAVLEEKGETPQAGVDCSADLAVSASIPDSFIESPGQRMDFYRRIASLKTQSEAEDMLDELIDRYGQPPDSVCALIDIALLRARAGQAGVSEISQKGERMIFKLQNADFPRISAICANPAYRGRVLFSAGETPYLSLRTPKGIRILDEAKAFIDLMNAQ